MRRGKKNILLPPDHGYALVEFALANVFVMVISLFTILSGRRLESKASCA